MRNCVVGDSVRSSFRYCMTSSGIRTSYQEEPECRGTLGASFVKLFRALCSKLCNLIDEPKEA